MSTFGEAFNAAGWLLHTAAPDRIAATAVALDGSMTDLTYRDLDDLTWQAAAALVAAGVRAEERLLLCMADTPELVALFLGALSIGAVPVPVSTMATAADLAGLVRDSRARLLAVSAEFLPSARDAAGLPGLRDIVVAGDSDDLDPLLVPGRNRAGRRLRTLPAFLAAAGADDEAAARAAEPTLADSPAFWLYTSGTTGTPKAAMHRHGALRTTAFTYAASVLGVGPDDVCYSAAKFFFAYGLGNTLTFPLSAGAAHRARPGAGYPRPAGQRADHRPAHPVLRRAERVRGDARRRAARRRLRQRAAGRQRRRIAARRPVQALHQPVRGRGARRHRVYRGAAHIRLQPARPGTAGYDRGGRARLRAADRGRRGRPVADGEPGGLYVKGDSTATGYWCRSEVTRRVFRGEWLRTGDIYARDADGYYSCLGRSDDVLKVRGMWVSPAEVEIRLRAHPGVEQAVVVAIPDADGLDTAVACVVLRPGEPLTADELIAFCRAGLAAFKRPRHVLFLDGLPLTATGKVQRFRLRELALAALADRRSPAEAAAADPATGNRA